MISSASCTMLTLAVAALTSAVPWKDLGLVVDVGVGPGGVGSGCVGPGEGPGGNGPGGVGPGGMTRG